MSRIALDDEAVVIIGSGAGGGTLANELCQRGIACVVLEAGPRFSLADFEQDEFVMAGRFSTGEPPEVTSPAPLENGRPYVCRGVGGTTLHWSGIALRLLESEMRARSTYGAIDGTNLADWPIPYPEMQKYYGRAEDRMGVTGTHGNPPMPANNNFKVLYAGGKRLGYSKINTSSLAINTSVRDGRPGCAQMGFCMQGCVIAAKWCTLYTEIQKAEATGRLDLRPQCTALRIEHDAGGRASAVIYVDAEGRQQRQKARVVCVACNSVESARLLLNSDSSRFPDGLANSSGQVGRNYMTHSHAFVMARMPKPVHLYRGTVQAGLLEDERPHAPQRGFAAGYLLQTISLGLPLMTLAMKPGAWGAELARFMESYTHLAGLVILGEDLAQADNRVTLSRTRKDRHGMPLASIHFRHHANDEALIGHARRQATALYRAVGAEEVHVADTTGFTHNMGTNRMSLAPRDGVVDPWGRAHDVPNLFISDGSQFVTSGAANPTLTIVALALRQADHLAGRLAAREL